ncbi:MAG: prolyl oligopeptidase family serine peptidase [Gammaproteobacteria bacterium]|nr:prolyl oligopeptidase family serine peptidase [Gammaproteobacteria bacterium]
MDRFIKPLTILSLVLFYTEAVFAKQPLPLDTFLKQSDYLEVKLSPDGKHFATRVRDDNRVFLAMVRLADGKIVGGVNPGDNDEIGSVTWANNKKLIYTFADKDARDDSASHTGELMVVDVNGKNIKLLAGYRAGESFASHIKKSESSHASHYLLSTLPDEPTKVLIVEYPWTLRGNTYYDDRTRLPIVSKLDISSGKKSRREIISKRDADLFADREGNINFMTWPMDNGYLNASYRESPKHDWVDISDAFGEDFDDFVASRINNDGTKAYFYGTKEDDLARTLYEFDLKSRKLTKLFDNIVNLHSWEVDTNGEPYVGVSFPNKIAYHYVKGKISSPEVRMHRSLVAGFNGEQVWLNSHSKDGTKHTFKVTSSVNPGKYFVYDSVAKRATFVWANYSWIDPKQMQKKQAVEYQASDGVLLRGYLTLPELAANAQAPLVVVPHGGPHGVRDYPFFDYETQLLANRGFAVLQINFRGSGGYTADFEESGYKKWGTRMIDDILDATKATLKRDDIDKTSACIYGASYGGFAALSAVAREPGLFNCSAGYVGVYDLEAMRVKGDIPKSFWGMGYLDYAIGDDIDDLRSQSPIYMADKIDVPVLLIHGDKDVRVPSYHSKVMREALTKAGNEPEWLYLGAVGHGAVNLKNRTKVYEKLLGFLEKNIKKTK